MRYLLFSCIAVYLTSCTILPDFFKAADDILTNDAITITVDRDALKDNVDVHVLVDVVHVKAGVAH